MRPVALRHQLLVVLVVPALIVIAVTAYFADMLTRRVLDAALGDRLCSIAQSAATLVGPRVIVLEPGDDDTRVKRSVVSKLRALLDATHVDRILIVRANNHGVIVDSKDELKVGDEYVRARFDLAELESVEKGQSVASVLFTGSDGRPYKTGYAPLLDEEGRISAYVGVNGQASFFEVLGELRAALSAVALLGLALLAFVASVAARRVSVPLSLLSEAAVRIGSGNLDSEIPTGGPEEAVVLSETMRAMAASLRSRDEEMQMMLAGIAHEVRNPLGGIELFAGLLKEDLADPDPRRKHVEKILRELGVLAKVVNDFLDFARRSPPALQRTDVRELLLEAIALSEQEAKTKQVEIAHDLAHDLVPTVFARIEPEAIKRAVLNLLKNAVQAAPIGGLVRVQASVGAAGGTVVGTAVGTAVGVATELTITVSDTGPGIPREKRADIFKPFYTTKEKGTGLGLALVKKTVDAHYGQIRIEDTEAGGARFVIVLPGVDAS